MRCLFLLCLTALLVPQAALALMVSEVAWMGTSAAADDEWIELYNDGANMSLEGWVVEFGQSSIPLTGSLASGAYAVLHRGGETAAPGSPLLTYSGALANTGTTIILRRPDGSAADTVNASAGWPAGDNITKETMQRQGGSWVTAPHSAGFGAFSSVNTQNDDTEKSSSNQPRTLPFNIRPREENQKTETTETVERELNIIGSDVGYKGHPMQFSAQVQGVGERFVPSLRYEWNFGELSEATGKEVWHTYEHPGVYLVTLYASFGAVELVARKEITVREVPLSLQRNEQGAVLITNNAAYEVLLDGYVVRSTFAKSFPKRSILLPGATVTIKASLLGNDPTAAVYLLDNRGVLVGEIGGNRTAQSADVATQERGVVSNKAVRQSQNHRHSARPQVAGFSFSSQDDMATTSSSASPTPTIGSEVEKGLSTKAAATSSSVTYYVLAALLIFGVLGVLIRK